MADVGASSGNDNKHGSDDGKQGVRIAEISVFYNGEIYAERSASGWLQLLRNAAAVVFEKVTDALLAPVASSAPSSAQFDNNDNSRSGFVDSNDNSGSALQLMSSRAGFSARAMALTDIDVLDEEMLFRLQHQWQQGAMSRGTYTTTSWQIFDKVVETGMDDPEQHIAVIEPRTNKSVSYAELQRHSKLFAVWLHELFADRADEIFGGDDATVALYLPRCADWYKVMLGCHRAGAAYLSLDPDYPTDRLAMILEDSAAMAVVTFSSMTEKLEQLDYKGKIILLDKLWDEILAPRNAELLEEFISPTTPRTPAYYIFTSGSTGRPKGVCIEHVNLCAFVLSEVKIFGLSNRHRIIQGFSTSFDASVEEIWLAFASGSALVVVEKAVMQDADALSSLISKHKVTVFSTVPSLLALMDAKRVPRLELVISGAEALNKEVVEAWAPVAERERLAVDKMRQQLGDKAPKYDRETEELLRMSKRRRFANSYGPTETTVACMVEFITRPLFYRPGQPRRAVSIGRAQPNYVAFVVDERLQLVPPGVAGELCIAGPAVARGYVGERLVAMTEEKFVACPFHDRFKRMYRTGDLVRWSTEGKMLFLGRIDSQVKLRGFRIEVGEIETQLATFPGVTTAVVVLRTDAGGEPYLCAYVVCTEDLKAHFSESAMRRHLAQTLPKYMLPSRFAWVDAMPRTPAGKLNRKGFAPPPPPLPEDDGSAAAAAGGGASGGKAAAAVPPSSENEKLLFPLWKALVPNLKGVHDNFFEIGGHSLLAGKLASSIRRKGFESCNISFIFLHPTVASLAAVLPEREHAAEAEIELPPLEFEPSLLRKALFLLWQLIVMFAVYLMSPIFVITLLSIYGFTADFETVVDRATIRDPSSWDVAGFTYQSLVLGALIAASSFAHLFVICPILSTRKTRCRTSGRCRWSRSTTRWTSSPSSSPCSCTSSCRSACTSAGSSTSAPRTRRCSAKRRRRRRRCSARTSSKRPERCLYRAHVPFLATSCEAF
jgi:non-ribosomal peptide synthetase component F